MATNNNNKVLNVPPLRFPEFSGEWRYLPLNEYLYENKERNKTGFFNKTSVLSVSGDFGVINQIQLLGRSFAGKSVLDYHVVRHGNIIYTKSPLKDFPYGIVKMNEGADGIVSTLYAVYNVRINASGKFIESYFALPRRANKYFKPIVRIGAKHDMKISNTEAIANIVCFPQYVEQQKIAKFLALIGTRISTQNKIIEDLEQLKSTIRERLYTQIQEEDFEHKTIKDVLSYEHPTKYIVVDTEYTDDKKLTPVLTANKAFILGYTPEQENIYGKGDCIIFDDFTMDIKFVSFPFKIKSSAIKILTAKTNVNLYFIYEYLLFLNLISEEHKRHYISEIEPLHIVVPCLVIQHKIAEILQSIDKQIHNARQLQSAYQRQKQYLLNQMFI